MGYIIDVLVGNIIGFIAGTVLTWSSPVQLDLEHPTDAPFGYPLTSEQTSWISSLLALGAIVGPFVFGILADKIGRKPTLLVCAVPFLIGFLVFSFVLYPWIFYVARFLMGMSVGGVFTVVPIYIGEVAEVSNRGALGTSLNCYICFGFFFSHFAGSYLSFFVFNLILSIFPATFIVLFFIIAEESPHYYVIKGKLDQAEMALKKIRKGSEEVINEELMEMVEKVKESQSGSFLDIFKHKGLRKGFLICVCLLGFQQFSGINAVLFYVEGIFTYATTNLHPKVCSIIVGATQFLTSFTTPLVVDRVGRKVLLIVSAVGIIISEVPLGIYCYMHIKGYHVEDVGFIPILCLVMYIIMFNTGLAILPWSMMGELFPDSVKFKASSLATSITWFLGFFIAKYFPSATDNVWLGIAFWIFAGFCIICIPFTIFYVIETKGKSLQEIQDILQNLKRPAVQGLQIDLEEA
ncbi:facilitated trehalose transporter Tret1-like [Anoplophora glabripennis]|uniref:facilitated trehalose transporter Tret1-like n=1 Tax=Anoplophora glabripennis TaxID=217634 RepID=UPI0008740DC8|nr:facilitated trehalose transporter Tret1-like [Anoplophora glabripennis]